MGGTEITLQSEYKIFILPEWIEIVEFLADGYNVAEVASAIKKNKRTLEAHITSMKDKLGCQTLAHLVALFFRKNLIK